MSQQAFAFEQLFEHASDPAFILDPVEDRFLAANPAGCAVLGYTFDELLVTPVSRIHPGELPQLQDFVGRRSARWSWVHDHPHLQDELW